VCTNGGTVTVIGAVDVTLCDGEHIVATATGESGTLNIDSAVVGSNDAGGPVIQFSAADNAAEPTDLILNLTGTTTVNPHDYDGVDVRTVRGDITVDIGEDVIINPDQTGVYVRTSETDSWPDDTPYRGGDIIIVNRGTVTAGDQPDPMGSNGIVGTANGGGVSISNYGTVTTTYAEYTSWDTYGILADGGYWSPEAVQVSIYNNGTVTALNDGLRINSYNGLGKAVNDVDGVITSNGRRGVVVWSAANSAELENYGEITSFDGPGVNVWSQGTVIGDASVVNGGSITAHDNEDRTVYTTLYNGAHIWSQVTGKAELTNLAGGSIEADDGWGVWMLSTDGDVIIDNAGRIKGETTAIHVGADGIEIVGGDPTPEYKGAVGGDLEVTNSGLLTAFGTITDSKFGLVTLGGDVGTASFQNEAGGIVGAGLDFEEGFDVASLQTMPAADFADLADAAVNQAIFAAIKADDIDITNEGLLFGRVVVGTPAAMSEGGDIPDTTGTVEVANSGNWVVSGLSSITGNATSATFRNTGTIWTLDKTAFDGDLVNAGGQLALVATGSHGASTSISGDYAASGAARVSLRWSADGEAEAIPGLFIAGDVTGETEVLIANPQQIEALDWSEPQQITLVTVEGDAADGAAHFFTDQRYGFSAYGLDYSDADDHTWSLTRGLNVDAMAALSNLAQATQDLFDLSSELATERMDDLRDIFFAGDAPEVEPAAYAETAPRSQAFSVFDLPQRGREGFAWVKGAVLTSSGAGYDADTGVYQGGIDLTAQMGDDLFAVGLFGGYGHTNLDFDLAATEATLDGGLFGVYGTYLADSGVFVNGTLLGQSFGVDATLSSVDSDFDGWSFGGRAEAGRRLDYGGLIVEPSLALQASRTSFDTVDVAAISAGFEDTDSLATEARLRLAGNLQRGNLLIKPYATLTAGYEFLADNKVVVPALDASHAGNDDGIYGDVNLGVTVGDAGDAYAALLQGNFDFSEDRTGAGLTLGGQVRF
jgi:outer membrane autotransporter protein